jgi:hypothetical protein
MSRARTTMLELMSVVEVGIAADIRRCARQAAEARDYVEVFDQNPQRTCSKLLKTAQNLSARTNMACPRGLR